MSVRKAYLPRALHQDNITTTMSDHYRILRCSLPKYADLLVSTQSSSRPLEPHVCNNHHDNKER